MFGSRSSFFQVHKGLRGWYFRAGRMVFYAGLTFTRGDRR